MSDLLVELALPRTDAGVLAQVGVAASVFGLAFWRVRHNGDLRTFVAGLATLTFAWFALRALH